MLPSSAKYAIEYILASLMAFKPEHAIGESVHSRWPLVARQRKLDIMGRSTERIEDMGVAIVRAGDCPQATYIGQVKVCKLPWEIVLITV